MKLQRIYVPSSQTPAGAHLLLDEIRDKLDKAVIIFSMKDILKQ